MKADQRGTPTQQARHRMGWMTPTERRKAGRPKACLTCSHFHLEPGTNGWGGVSVKIRCGHPMTTGETGFATAESAVCDQWEHKA